MHQQRQNWQKPEHLRNLGQAEMLHYHVRHFLQCVETHMV
jgi:hypothetical protein